MAQEAVNDELVTDGRTGESDAGPNQEDNRRERSTIEFPYSDLDEVITVAKGVHAVGGQSCQIEQLAAHLDQSPTSSAFRQRLSAARVFNAAISTQGIVTLTNVGIRLCDPEQETSAKIDAFLAVPLYRSVYEKFKTATLPPAPGLESTMVTLGVAAKQKDRARQVFQRSAHQAGFFAYGPSRLVLPAIKPATAADPAMEPEKQTDKQEKKGGDGGDGNGLHPLIEGLIKSLPKDPEQPWPIEKRAKWLRAAAQNFDLIYPDTGDDSIEITVQRGK
jgi:hypothetical protein